MRVVVFDSAVDNYFLNHSDFLAKLEDLASHGYIVVTIDHIYDAGVVELPDGRVETVAVPAFTDANQAALSAKEIGSRVADVRF